MKNNILGNEIFNEIDLQSSKISDEKLSGIISGEGKINSRTYKLDLKKFKKFISQIKLAMSLIKDFKAGRYTDIPWRSLAMIAAAILYFINPMDLIPDILPVFGYGDDAMLFAAVFKSIQSDLEKYGDWKGINTSEFFLK